MTGSAFRSTLVFVCGAMISIMHAQAQVAPRAAGGRVYVTSDSESFNSLRLSADYLTSYTHLDIKTGVRYTSHYYSQHAWSRQGQQFSILSQNINRRTGEGWMVQGGVIQLAGHDHLLADLSWRKSFSQSAAGEVFINRDLIETAAAIDQGQIYTMAGTALDYQISPRWMAVGMLGEQFFSDGNQRSHARVRVIFQPDLERALTLQARVRYFCNSQEGSFTYYNPAKFQEEILALGWRKFWPDWQTNLLAGTGRQSASGNPPAPANVFEASAERQVKNYAVRLRAASTRSASYGGPDYRWHYIMADVNIPF